MNKLKGALASKTMWFNLIMLVMLSASLVSSQYTIDPKILALVMGFGNMFLRWITTGSLDNKVDGSAS